MNRKKDQAIFFSKCRPCGVIHLIHKILKHSVPITISCYCCSHQEKPTALKIEQNLNILVNLPRIKVATACLKCHGIYLIG